MEHQEIPSLGERLYLLREFYGRIWTILDAVCTGSFLIPDTSLNQYYVKLCLMIEKLLETADLSNLRKEYRRPFESLYNIDDVDWEYGGGEYVSGFFGKIEELWILNGQKVHKDPQIHDLLREIDRYTEQYTSRKNKVEANYMTGAKKGVEEWKRDMGEFEPVEFGKEKSVWQKETLPDNEFQFIREEILKSKVQRDYGELRKVYEIGAFKSVMVLSGGILETLLIEALSVEEKEAKFDYYQKYLEGKDRDQNPPNIENWQFYQLIEIAAQRKIISTDVKKICHIIKDYRNLIHLKAEIRDNLSVDKNVATSLVHLLLKAIDDISGWFKKQNLEL